MLNLCHCELSDSQQALSWGDFISEAEADLGCGEGNSAVVEFKETLEVDEDALGSFWTEEASVVTCRTNV